MLHQWSILFHEARGGKFSVVRRRDIDSAAAGGGSADAVVSETSGTETVDTGSTGSAAAATGSVAIEQPRAAETGTETAAPDEFAALEGLFPKEDDAAAAAEVVDPNAAAAALPEAVSKALTVSEYVKEPAQLANAVLAAQELWDVASGKVPAATMLEGMRSHNPEGFEKLVLNDLIPYIEQITGKKLGGAEAAAPDPLAEMQAKLERMEKQPQLEAQQRQWEQQRQTAETSSRTAVEGFIKSGSGIFDGSTDEALNGILAQLPKLGISVDALMRDQLAGKTELLEKAYKAAEKAEMVRVKAMTTRLIARNKALKNALPAGKGSPAAAVTSDELPLDATREEKVEWMRTGKFTRAAATVQ